MPIRSASILIRITMVLAGALAGLWAVGAARASALVYWTASGPSNGVLERAMLDGSGTNAMWTADYSRPLAVDSGHLYYVINNQLSRINLAADPTTEQHLYTLSGITGIAVDSTYVYFDDANGAIDRVNLDGSNPRRRSSAAPAARSSRV
jgi:hypothetical protein